MDSRQVDSTLLTYNVLWPSITGSNHLVTLRISCCYLVINLSSKILYLDHKRILKYVSCVSSINWIFCVEFLKFQYIGTKGTFRKESHLFLFKMMNIFINAIPIRHSNIQLYWIPSEGPFTCTFVTRLLPLLQFEKHL